MRVVETVRIPKGGAIAPDFDVTFMKKNGKYQQYPSNCAQICPTTGIRYVLVWYKFMPEVIVYVRATSLWVPSGKKSALLQSQ